MDLRRLAIRPRHGDSGRDNEGRKKTVTERMEKGTEVKAGMGTGAISCRQ